jgi:Domain of unknown function (DUF927)
MSNIIINSKSTPLIEKILNIFDESTETAFERFEFNDVRGSRATVELPRNESHKPDTLVAAIRLKNGDLPYNPDETKKATETAIKSKPKRFATRRPHVGWQIRKNAAKPYAFVLGSTVIQSKNAQDLVLPPSWLNDSLLLIPRGTGSLKAWQEEVATPALKSTRLTLAISCAVAATIMRQSGFQNFGINLYGRSKSGKSTFFLWNRPRGRFGKLVGDHGCEFRNRACIQ